MICTVKDVGLGKKIWDPKKNHSDGSEIHTVQPLLSDFSAPRRDLMPIITPAYPAYNSSFNVSKSTLQCMKVGRPFSSITINAVDAERV